MKHAMASALNVLASQLSHICELTFGDRFGLRQSSNLQATRQMAESFAYTMEPFGCYQSQYHQSICKTAADFLITGNSSL
ncbi:MAG: hypothetical protein E6Q60_08605 [Nitrosomonas oligotropha]|uniref:Uncharacterized protein n=1 Tax=Nitrosomonas oligotropha TaxID=42354 RepID=A0A5C7VRK3_9PROT|nr:MAG: hypothetical protein E6Q60_08605 [Nitrosomonas oligotropha]